MYVEVGALILASSGRTIFSREGLEIELNDSCNLMPRVSLEPVHSECLLLLLLLPLLDQGFQLPKRPRMRLR